MKAKQLTAQRPNGAFGPRRIVEHRLSEPKGLAANGRACSCAERPIFARSAALRSRCFAPVLMAAASTPCDAANRRSSLRTARSADRTPHDRHGHGHHGYGGSAQQPTWQCHSAMCGAHVHAIHGCINRAKLDAGGRADGLGTGTDERRVTLRPSPKITVAAKRVAMVSMTLVRTQVAEIPAAVLLAVCPSRRGTARHSMARHGMSRTGVRWHL